MLRQVVGRAAATVAGTAAVRSPLSRVSIALHQPAFMVLPAQSSAACSIRFYGSKKGGKKAGSGGKGRGRDDDNDDNDFDADAGGRSKRRHAAESAPEMTLDLDKVSAKMASVTERLVSQLAEQRIGRANPSLIDNIRVEITSADSSASATDDASGSSKSKKAKKAGGSATSAPLRDLATVAVKDPQTLVVHVAEPSHTESVKRAIASAGIGLNPQPSPDGAEGVLRVPVPKPTAELRQRIAKSLGDMAERAKTQVRDHRQAAHKTLKADSKENMPKDAARMWAKKIDDMTTKFVAQIDDMIAKKKDELQR